MCMRLFIWCDCDIAVAILCAMSHMEWVPNIFCGIVMCDSNINIHSKSHPHPLHHVNNFTKLHAEKRSRIQKESHRVNEPLALKMRMRCCFSIVLLLKSLY